MVGLNARLNEEAAVARIRGGVDGDVLDGRDRAGVKWTYVIVTCELSAGS